MGWSLVGLDLRRHRASLPRNMVVDEAEDFDERFETFWLQVNHGAVVSPVRDRAYLRWRYVENPEGGFHILRALRRDQLVGYLVGKLREEPNGARVGYVLDVAAGDEPILRMLIWRALRDFQAAGADWARCGLLPHRVGSGPFASVGFRRSVGRMPAVYVIYDETLDPQRFADPGQWDFTLGDSDIFM